MGPEMTGFEMVPRRPSVFSDLRRKPAVVRARERAIFEGEDEDEGTRQKSKIEDRMVKKIKNRKMKAGMEMEMETLGRRYNQLVVREKLTPPDWRKR